MAIWTDADRPARMPEGVAAFYTTDYMQTPPIEFTGGVEVRVRFTTESEILSICGVGAFACWEPEHQRIVMPNPCYPDPDTGNRIPRLQWFYERAVCHEIAHTHGWLHRLPPGVGRPANG
jgi:hypothetical protein